MRHQTCVWTELVWHWCRTPIYWQIEWNVIRKFSILMTIEDFWMRWPYAVSHWLLNIAANDACDKDLQNLTINYLRFVTGLASYIYRLTVNSPTGYYLIPSRHHLTTSSPPAHHLTLSPPSHYRLTTGSPPAHHRLTTGSSPHRLTIGSP